MRKQTTTYGNQITSYQLLLKMLAAPMPEGNACLLWPRGRNEAGYGILRLTKRDRKAHRVAYELTRGPIPEGVDVLHNCDNPPCFRPSHLWLGTDVDNVHDCIAKGRRSQVRGEHQGSARLSKEQVIRIRQLSASGLAFGPLAREFDVSMAHICRIVHRQTWKHI